MSALQTILIEMFTSEKDVTKYLTGGARLEWDALDKTLTATRINAGLQTTPDEQKTFEREIRIAGYKHGEGAPVSLRSDALNDRFGVRWTITKAAPSKKALKAEAQGSLF